MKKGEKRKQELLKIAYDLFISHGYEKTSVDEIIDKAKIAKGTYYHYFQSKDQMLEEVIEMMIESEVEMAKQIVASDMPVTQKIVGILTEMKPASSEQPIKEALFHPKNVLMHNKIRKKLIEILSPILTEVASEGVKEGVFECDNILERVRMLLVISDSTFNEGTFTDRDISVFIDTTEKLLGAKKGTMSFINGLIDKTDMEADR